MKSIFWMSAIRMSRITFLRECSLFTSSLALLCKHLFGSRRAAVASCKLCIQTGRPNGIMHAVGVTGCHIFVTCVTINDPARIQCTVSELELGRSWFDCTTINATHVHDSDSDSTSPHWRAPARAVLHAVLSVKERELTPLSRSTPHLQQRVERVSINVRVRHSPGRGIAWRSSWDAGLQKRAAAGLHREQQWLFQWRTLLSPHWNL